MKITISEIPLEGIELDVTGHIPYESGTIPVQGFLKIDKVAPEVFVTGAVSGDIEQQCSRCLKDFTITIKSQINFVYHPAEEIIKEEHHELKDDELDTAFYKNDILDTDDLFREQLILDIPMKPLCSADCKGICPKCGADLNATTCNCITSEIDPRLAVLKQLIKRKE